MTEVIEIKGLDSLVAKLKHLPDLLGNAMFAAMTDATSLVNYEVTTRTPVGATSNLRGSIKQEVTRGTSITGIRGKVMSAQGYALFVEEGTKPRSMTNRATWPPIAPLKLWVRRKGWPESAAYGVRWHIVKYGTKAHQMFKKGAEAAKKKIPDIFLRHFHRAIDSITKK